MNRRLIGFLKWIFLIFFVAAMIAGFWAARSFLQSKIRTDVPPGWILGFGEVGR